MGYQSIHWQHLYFGWNVEVGLLFSSLWTINNFWLSVSYKTNHTTITVIEILVGNFFILITDKICFISCFQSCFVLFIFLLLKRRYYTYLWVVERWVHRLKPRFKSRDRLHLLHSITAINFYFPPAVWDHYHRGKDVFPWKVTEFHNVAKLFLLEGCRVWSVCFVQTRPPTKRRGVSFSSGHYLRLLGFDIPASVFSVLFQKIFPYIYSHHRCFDLGGDGRQSLLAKLVACDNLCRQFL